MFYKTAIIFHVIITFIQANNEKDAYTVMSAGGHAIKTNSSEDIQIVKLDGDQDLVRVQLFYECLCPGCRYFDTTQFSPTIQALHSYLQIGVFPYGNAKTEVVDGKYVFTCQHGPAECYGNKLHSCAIDYIKNLTLAISYNACMMEVEPGSDDETAIKCGNSMNIASKPIIDCANSERGSILLYNNGLISKAANFTGVPYVLINGKEHIPDDRFMKEVCAAFTNTPPPCKNIQHTKNNITSA